MKKHQFAILTGILLSVFTVMGCGIPSETEGSGFTSEKEYKVTFDFGKYGESVEGNSKETQTALLNYVSKDLCIIKPEYKLQVEFEYWHEKGVAAEFDSTKKITSDITLYAQYKAKNVGAVNFKPNEDSLFVSWKAIPDSKYKVEYSVGSGVSTSETLSNNYMNISEVSEGTSCTVKVTTVSNDSDVLPSEVITGSGSSGLTELDWLVLLYMDGDNNLNDPIYLDLNEAEYGLSKLTSNDYSSVKVVALWDGWDFKTSKKDEDVSLFDQAPADFDVHATAATRLLELAADSNVLYSNSGISMRACQLSPNTKDLTGTADWIQNGEVDMSKASTLESYLKWALKNYKAKKIILQFSNHGGGPRSVSRGKNSYGRRSMCWDETSSGGDFNAFLKTSDVSTALKNAGFGPDNQLELIMEDVCLGGSIEEAYQLKDYAKYYVGSPNNIPAMGFDYTSFVMNLKVKNITNEIGNALVSQFKTNYTMDKDDWDDILKKVFNITADELNYRAYETISLYTPSCSTLSFIDLSKIGAVTNAVNALAETIYSKTGDDPYLKIGNDGYYELNEEDNKFYLNGNTTSKTGVNGDSLNAVSVRDAIKYWTAYYGDPISYEGTFGCLKDLGYMARTILDKYSDDSDLKSAAEKVMSAMRVCVISAWRDGYKYPTYYINNKSFSPTSHLYNSNDSFGLTINTAVWVNHPVNGKMSTYHEYEDWYEKELDFGTACDKWTDLVKYWFAPSN